MQLPLRKIAQVKVVELKKLIFIVRDYITPQYALKETREILIKEQQQKLET